jgi:hypothetical protein
MGYLRAGAEVVHGVDIVPRPNYCGTGFTQTDALSGLAELISRGVPIGYDLIHASCPCQEASTLTRGTNRSQGWGREHLPYVIEQPQGSRIIRRDLRLCMDMWPVEPPRVWRHRDFEVSGFTVPQPVHAKHVGRVRGWRHGVRHAGDYVAAYGSGGGKATVAEMQHALGIDWTDVREELTEAIPPAYTEHIGRAFLAQSLTQ